MRRFHTPCGARISLFWCPAAIYGIAGRHSSSSFIRSALAKQLSKYTTIVSRYSSLSVAFELGDFLGEKMSSLVTTSDLITNDSVKPSSIIAKELVLVPQVEKAMWALQNLLKEARPLVSREDVPGVWNILGSPRQDGVLVEIPIGAEFGLVGDPNCKLSSIGDLLAGRQLTNVMAMRRAGAWVEPNGFVRCCAKPLILSALVPRNLIQSDVDSKGPSDVDTKVIIANLSLVNVWRIGLFRVGVDGDFGAQLKAAWENSCDELGKLLARISLGTT